MSAATLLAGAAFAADDPYLWLETPKDPKALEWARTQSDQTKAALSAKPEYAAISEELKGALAAAPPAPTYGLLNDKIVRVSRDVAHPHGVVEVADRGPDGAPGPFRVVLDMEKFRAEQGKPYELHTNDFESACLAPAFDRCLLSLSPGGADDVELREFDLKTGAFVSDGFRLGAGRANFAWLNRDHLLISSTAFGDPVTPASFSNTVRVWTRGQAPDAARVIWRGEPNDQFAQLTAIGEGATRQGVINQIVDYSTFKFFLVGGDGKTRPVDLDVRVKSFGLLANTSRYLVFQTSEAGTVGGAPVAAESLIAYDTDPATPPAARWSVIYTPKGEEAIIAVGLLPQLAATRSTVEFIVNDHLNQRPMTARFENGGWQVSAGAATQRGTSIGYEATDHERDDVILQTTGFVTPDRLDLVRSGAAPLTLYAQAPIFDASGYTVEVRSTASRDGTRVDYYLLRPKHVEHPGATPTIITGYGAFGVVFLPDYFGFDVGGAALKVWLSRGGALALPIIRGGGERGDAWHRVAMGAHRQLSYDDFLAATQDLEKDFTTPAHMGVFGSSNGGLLAATAAIERPDLYAAAISDVPLTDMLRLPYMGMGAAWLDEYGDPKDPAMRAAILRYSPYQNVREGVKYPPFMITASTQDNRVGPGHARKLAARLEAVGDKVYFFEDQEGGHGVSDPLARPDLMAMRMTFLIDTLMGGK
jgi:prolyl oligopeptidase